MRSFRPTSVAVFVAAALLSATARGQDASTAAADDGLEEVVITAIVDAASRASEAQKRARNVTNVVSADAIGRFPDPNIAEALQRVTGIAIARDQGEGRYVNVRGGPSEFSATTIDGVTIAAPDPSTRAIDLDTLPSDIVQSLEISKTLRPDQEADSITGQINIKTNSPFDRDGFSLRGSLGGSYNQFGSTNDVRGAFSVSNIWGDDQRFGLLFSGSYSETDRQLDNIETGWERFDRPEGGEIFGVAENLFKDYDTQRERMAFTGAAEWRPTDDTRVYARSTYSRYTDDEFRNQLLVLWADGVLLPGATDRSASFRNIRVAKQIRHRIQRNEITTAEVGFERPFGALDVDASVSIANSEQDYPRRDELLWRTAALGTATAPLSYDYSNSRLAPTISLFTSNQHLNAANFSFRENAYRVIGSEEELVAFAANASLPVSIGGGEGTFKFGAKLRSGDRSANEDRFRNRAASAAPSGSLASFLTTEPSLNFGYDLGFKVDPALADAYFDATKAASPIRPLESVTADYEVEERILAGYAMWDLDFGPLGVLAGVRAERTTTEGAAPVVNEDTLAVAIRSDKRSYTDLFPGVTLRYEFSDRLIGRAALTRGMVRPNFLDIVPRAVESEEGTQIVVTTGNPELEPTLSNNLDASLEYYFDRIGLISASAFYKDLKDYAYELRSAGTYLGQAAILIRPENAPEGKLSGVELAWQQQFTNLPGWLAGFGVFANFTWVDAEIDVGRVYAGRSKFPLPGQSDTVSNFAVFYEQGPISVRLSYTDRGDYLDEINADDAELDLYWQGRSQLDLTASYQFAKQVEGFVEAKNLTNTAGIRYFGTRERVYEYEKFGYSVFVGARVKL
jgi:TonB-dependent receptor